MSLGKTFYSLDTNFGKIERKLCCLKKCVVYSDFILLAVATSSLVSHDSHVTRGVMFVRSGGFTVLPIVPKKNLSLVYWRLQTREMHFYAFECGGAIRFFAA